MRCNQWGEDQVWVSMDLDVPNHIGVGETRWGTIASSVSDLVHRVVMGYSIAGMEAESIGLVHGALLAIVES